MELNGNNNKMIEIIDKLISVVIPVYNEAELIIQMIDEVIRVTKDSGYCFEIILINDGSTDDTWKQIENLTSYESGYSIRGISFSRNFGKESAILAGLAYSRGLAVITIDGDLQHPPDKILEFIRKWEQGAKIVEGIKRNRGKERKVHRLFSNVFYHLLSHALRRDLSNASDYKLLDREVVDIILCMPEKQMFYRAITFWVGFKTDTIEYEVMERTYGKSKWSAFTLFLYAIRNITSFTTAPLQIITICSGLFIILGIFEMIITLKKWFEGTAVEGFATVILLQLISGGLIMFTLGLIGYYLSKLVDEMRNRPRYIVEKEIGQVKEINVTKTEADKREEMR